MDPRLPVGHWLSTLFEAKDALEPTVQPVLLANGGANDQPIPSIFIDGAELPEDHCEPLLVLPAIVADHPVLEA